MSIIGIVRGDGIGPELVSATLEVLEAVSNRYSIQLDYKDLLIGQSSLERYGISLSESTVVAANSCDCILTGLIGGSSIKINSADDSSDDSILDLAQQTGLYLNFIEAHSYIPASYTDYTTKLPSNAFVDIAMVVETNGGPAFVEQNTYLDNGLVNASDTLSYSEAQIEKAFNVAYEIAQERKCHVTCVDKADVFEVYKLWRMVIECVKSEHPDVTTDFMYLDNCAAQLIKNPLIFDVILTDTLFAKLIAAELAILSGTMMLPWAYVGDSDFGIYGIKSYMDAELKSDEVNPIAMINSAAMMFKYSLKNDDAYKSIKKAIKTVIDEGYRTVDVMRDGFKQVSTFEFGELVAQKIR